MNERNCIAFNEDAREWSNNNRKPYMSTIVGYPFSAYRMGSTISNFYSNGWILIKIRLQYEGIIFNRKGGSQIYIIFNQIIIILIVISNIICLMRLIHS
jgi:hypothetical protein